MQSSRGRAACRDTPEPSDWSKARPFRSPVEPSASCPQGRSARRPDGRCGRLFQLTRRPQCRSLFESHDQTVSRQTPLRVTAVRLLGKLRRLQGRGFVSPVGKEADHWRGPIRVGLRRAAREPGEHQRDEDECATGQPTILDVAGSTAALRLLQRLMTSTAHEAGPDSLTGSEGEPLRSLRLLQINEADMCAAEPRWARSLR